MYYFLIYNISYVSSEFLLSRNNCAALLGSFYVNKHTPRTQLTLTSLEINSDLRQISRGKWVVRAVFSHSLLWQWNNWGWFCSAMLIFHIDEFASQFRTAGYWAHPRQLQAELHSRPYSGLKFAVRQLETLPVTWRDCHLLTVALTNLSCMGQRTCSHAPPWRLRRTRGPPHNWTKNAVTLILWCIELTIVCVCLCVCKRGPIGWWVQLVEKSKLYHLFSLKCHQFNFGNFQSTVLMGDHSCMDFNSNLSGCLGLWTGVLLFKS